MRVACVNQDPGIRPGRSKGAAVHLAAMRHAFAELGADTVVVDEPDAVEARLEEAWAEAPIDIVYERYALAKPAAARFASAKGIPLILEVNAPLSEEATTWRGYEETSGDAWSDRFVFRSAERVIAVSTSVADYALSRGARREVVRVFPNGVDLEAFRPRRHDDPLRAELVPDGRFALGFHGRLRPWHGFPMLVEAGCRLLELGVPIHLLIVGKGDFSAHLDGTPLAEHVSIVGWQPHERIGSYVAAFDVLPLTYGEDQPCYFSPLKLAEAMACGVVPVVPALGDLPETVGDGGLVYPPSDAGGLVDAIQWLFEDPELRRERAGLAVERAERLSWRRIAEYVLAQASAPAAGPTAAAASGREGA